MNVCLHCDAKLKDEAAFCGNCGSQVPEEAHNNLEHIEKEAPSVSRRSVESCEACGSALAGGASFCGSCGSAQNSVPVPAENVNPQTAAGPVPSRRFGSRTVLVVAACVMSVTVAAGFVLGVGRSNADASSSQVFETAEAADEPRPSESVPESSNEEPVEDTAELPTVASTSTTLVEVTIPTSPTLPPTTTAPSTTVATTTTTTAVPQFPAPQVAQVIASEVRDDSTDACGAPITYSPQAVLDQIANTAWMVKGDGVGQTLTFFFEERSHVTTLGLIPGYAKLDPCSGADRFDDLRKIRRVRWSFDDGTSVEQIFDPPAASLTSIPVDVVTSQVQLTILETDAPGNDLLNNTPISEVLIS